MQMSRSRPPQHSSLPLQWKMYESCLLMKRTTTLSMAVKVLILAILIFAGAHNNFYYLLASIKPITV